MTEDQTRHTSQNQTAAAPTRAAKATLMLLPRMPDQPSMQDLQENLAGLISGVLQTNISAAQEIFHAASPEDILELQRRFVRDYMAALITGTITLVRTIQKTAEQPLPVAG